MPPPSPPRQPSGGVLFIAAGILIYLAGCLQFSVSGGLWPTFLAAFAFSCYGLKRAHTRSKKILALAIVITSGGMTLFDLARTPAAAKAWHQLRSGFRDHADE